MCTSAEDCFCQEQVRQSCGPKFSLAQLRSSSAESGSSSCASRSASSGEYSNPGVVSAITEYCPERVGAKPESKRLETESLLGRDVAEVHLGAVVGDEPGLSGLERRLENEVVDRNLVRDLFHEPGAHLARGPEDACGAALSSLGDHFPGTAGIFRPS